MIQSMTGYGAAQGVGEGASYALEVRSLNHRYLKLSIKLPEYLQFLESDVDKLLRGRLSRGSVTYTLRVRSDGEAGPRSINVAALQHYVDQIARVEVPTGVRATLDLGAITTLPGVYDSPELDEEAKRARLEMIADLTGRAADDLMEMRRLEGRTIAGDLSKICDAIQSRLLDVGARAPNVVEEYHERLKSRVDALLKSGGFELEAEGLMREVAIYAERCDISEEIARLESHLQQFMQLCKTGDQVGRTLDFLTQELLREANTIASKSNDATIARAIVEIKGLIDRLKEQIQNVE